MRMFVTARMPHEPFNSLLRKGVAAEKMNQILEAMKPETVFFTEIEGRRTAMFIVNLENASQIPAIAEPWFLTFQADVRLHPIMSPEDMQQSGIAELGKKWG